jgi:hypothetical protein
MRNWRRRPSGHHPLGASQPNDLLCTAFLTTGLSEKTLVENSLALGNSRIANTRQSFALSCAILGLRQPERPPILCGLRWEIEATIFHGSTRIGEAPLIARNAEPMSKCKNAVD